MKRNYVILFCIGLCPIFSCSKEDASPSDPWAENVKLIPKDAQFYCIADVEGVPGMTKLIYPGPNDNGSVETTRAICNGDECHTIYRIGDPDNWQKFWMAISFYKKGKNGFDNLVHEGKYKFTFPTDRVNGVTIVLITDQFSGQNDHLDNNQIAESNFEITKIDESFDHPFIEARFNCSLQMNNGQIVKLKNAIWRIGW